MLAIVVGFGLGLIITFGIWIANKSLKSATIATSPTPSPISVSSTTPPPTPETTNTLTITSPADEALVSTGTIALTGKTTAGSVITVTFEDDETILQADDKGDFTAQISLVGGYNTIVVTSIDPTTGTESSQTLIVTYSTAKI